MEIRLPAPARRSSWAARLAVPVGLVVLVAPLAAIATQGLHPLDRLDALMLALAGAVMLGWGLWQVLGPAPRLQHDTALQLDGVGVTVQGADAGAMLTWPDVAVVEVRWWEIVPPYVDEADHLPVLRFVARDDRDISTNGSGVLATQLAQSFGMSPPAAALTVVVGDNGIEALEQVLGWIASYRPDVAVEVENLG